MRLARQPGLGSGDQTPRIPPFTRARRREPMSEGSPADERGILSEEPKLAATMKGREYF